MPQLRVRVTCIVWDGSHRETVGPEHAPSEEYLARAHEGNDRIARRRVHISLDRRVDAIDREED